MSVVDYEIIKRKLLIEGDGGSDDRRISNLLRTFLRWCDVSESEEDCNNGFQRMLATIAQCELTMKKSLHVCEMNKKEQANYRQLHTHIEESIKEAAENIAECKIEMQNAKRIRKNRQEYDNLAKVIQQHPDRQHTCKQLEVLDSQLKTLKDAETALNEKLELRKKQFHLFIMAVYEMQRILENVS